MKEENDANCVTSARSAARCRATEKPRRLLRNTPSGPPEEEIKASAAAMAQRDTPEMRTMQLDGIRMQRASRRANWQADLQKWEQDYRRSRSLSSPATRRPGSTHWADGTAVAHILAG